MIIDEEDYNYYLWKEVRKKVRKEENLPRTRKEEVLKVSSYDAFLGNFRVTRTHNPLLRYFDAINSLYDRSHGGLRYALSQLPVTGKIRQFADEYRKWDDAYANTGLDPNYSTAYGHAGIPFVNDALAPLTKPMRMARTLSKMYGAEVELDIAKERFKTARQYGHNAELWRNAWKERNSKQ